MFNEDLKNLFEDALGFASIGLVRYKLNGEITFIDKNALKIFEIEDIFPSPEKVIGKKISDIQKYILPPGSIRKKILENGYVRAFEYPLETLKGKKKWFLHHSYLVWDEKNNENCIQVILQDITELKETKLSLEWAINRFQAIANSSNGIALISFDSTKQIVLWNNYAEILYGIEKSKVSKLQDLSKFLTSEQINNLEKLLDKIFKGEPLTELMCWVIKNKNGEEKRINFTITPVYGEDCVREALCIQIDTTKEYLQRREIEQLQSHLEHVRKLESIGTLAAGIAHEFNNILMGILGNAELALLYGENLPSKTKDYLLQIRKSTERAARLTRELLTYAGKEKEPFQILDFGDLVKHTLEILIPTVPKGTLISSNIEEGLSPIEGTSNQLMQLVTHLFNNAVESLPESAGKIEIKVGRISLSKEELGKLIFSDHANPGEYIYFSITDTGTGIKEEHISKIFDPFFSTKFLGRGLGLATVATTVRNHKGAIKVETEVGKGSTFTVYLPVLAVRPKHEIESSKGLILIIDDELEIQKLLFKSLSKEGYKVIQALNGIEGLNLLNSYGNKIDLLILDIILPDISGNKILAEVNSKYPELPILIISGYTEESLESSISHLKYWDFMMKPFSIREITQKIKELFNTKKS
ncbi:MAG: ATP-binding protein [Candidatus Hydrogenedentes bacterium]|nr:ATP-binding protein [Candidatus Hydrogenedentota bacterium]